MRIFKSHPLLKLLNSYLIDSPQPSNINFLLNFGSLLAFFLAIQIFTSAMFSNVISFKSKVQKHVLSFFNSLVWALSSPDKAHAFVSLPLQSEFSSILIFDSTIFSNISDVIIYISNIICNIFNAIATVSSAISYMHDVFVLLSLDDSLGLVLYCQSSTDSTLKPEHNVDTGIKAKDKHKEVSPVVNVTYISYLSQSGITKRVLVDLYQAEGLRLRELWPQRSYPTKPVLVDGVMRTGIELPERRHDGLNSTLHPEIVRAEGPMPIGCRGIWASAHVRVPNLRVVTRGHPVETIAFRSPHSTNGTGQAWKSFIMDNN